MKKLILQFEVLQAIHSDQGIKFINKIWGGISNILKIKHTRTLGYDLQCNGLFKRFNRTLLMKLC